MARQYRLTLPRRVLNVWVRFAATTGLAPRRVHLLSVRGRKTGRVYSTPVSLVERDGQTFLVAPYGETGWLKNARAAGEVTLRHGRRSFTKRLQQLPPAEVAPVLRDYIRQNSITRPFFDARVDSPDSALEAEAAQHPVFRLV